MESPGPTARGFSWWAVQVLAPVVLGILVLAQTWFFRVSTCETFDEFTYLRLGVCIYRQADFPSLASPMCPPLPILLEYWLPALQARFTPGTEEWEQEVPGLIRQARFLTSVQVGVPLVLVVHVWLSRRRGLAVGILGGALVALSPSVLAAASIATTDACFVLFTLIALAVLHGYQRRVTRKWFLTLGVALGLALASKQSAVFLVPVVLGELWLLTPGRDPGSTRVDFALKTLFRIALRSAGLIGLAFLVDWALYGFGIARYGVAGTHTTVPVFIPMMVNLLPNGEAIMAVINRLGAPLAFDTFMGQMDHAANGHSAFLMGRHSFRGWWYFFPVAIALKSTPAELFMISLVGLLACRPSSWRDPVRRLWLGSVVVLLGAGMLSSINIGHRYMLAIYPLIVLLAIDWVGQTWAIRPARTVAFGVLLLTWQVVSIVGIAPHYLSYFNSLCGGPSQGHRYLVDSSLDWGQDLPSLRRELEARNYQKVAFCYFGTARASSYGLRVVNWMEVDGPDISACDWLAISATSLQGAYGSSSELYELFRDLPSIRAGYSIFLYDLKDTRVRAVWNQLRSKTRVLDRESSSDQAL